jgi:hypothetical protein
MKREKIRPFVCSTHIIVLLFCLDLNAKENVYWAPKVHLQDFSRSNPWKYLLISDLKVVIPQFGRWVHPRTGTRTAAKAFCCTL